MLKSNHDLLGVNSNARLVKEGQCLHRGQERVDGLYLGEQIKALLL